MVKGLRQCAKLHDFCEVVIVVVVILLFRGNNKVPSYFVGFTQYIFNSHCVMMILYTLLLLENTMNTKIYWLKVAVKKR